MGDKRELFFDFSLSIGDRSHDYLMGSVGYETLSKLKKRRTSKYRRATNTIIANLVNAHQTKRDIKLGSRDSFYPSTVGKRVFMFIWNFFRDEGLIELVRAGYMDRVTGKQEVAVFRPTELFTDIVEADKRSRGISRWLGELLIPRTVHVTSEKLRKTTVLESDEGKSKPFSHSISTTSGDRILQSCNKLLAKAEFEVHGVSTTFQLQRRFQNDLESHGRIYAMGGLNLQNLRRVDRPYLRINGCTTTEWDFKNMFGVLAYLSVGSLPPDRDIYLLDCFAGFGQSELFRSLAKKAFNIMLNTRSLNAAASALHKAFKECAEEFQTQVPTIDFGQFDYRYCRDVVIREIIDANAPINCLFFKYVGLNLMFYESEICLGVIRDFLEMGEVLLPIHDSFVCRREHGHFLRDSMIRNFQKVAMEKFGVPNYVPKLTEKKSGQ